MNLPMTTLSMRHTITALLLALVGFCQAAIAPKSDDRMMEEADGVIVGEVLKVTSKTEDGEAWDGLGKEIITYYTSTIKISEVRKGETFEAGKEVKIETMQVEWIGKGDPPPGHSGHFHQPAKGEKVLVFFTKRKDEGTWFATLQNGMQLLEAAEKE